MNIFRIFKGNRFVEGLLLEADLATLTEVLGTNLTKIQIETLHKYKYKAKKTKPPLESAGTV